MVGPRPKNRSRDRHTQEYSQRPRPCQLQHRWCRHKGDGQSGLVTSCPGPSPGYRQLSLARSQRGSALRGTTAGWKCSRTRCRPCLFNVDLSFFLFTLQYQQFIFLGYLTLLIFIALMSLSSCCIFRQAWRSEACPSVRKLGRSPFGSIASIWAATSTFKSPAKSASSAWRIARN